ncbi:MAG: hypothetical protein ABI625_20255 [bacterium]
MSDIAGAQTTRPETPKRITLEGRAYGNISFDDETDRANDSSRRTTASLVMNQPLRVSAERRDTGARRRVSGA